MAACGIATDGVRLTHDTNLRVRVNHRRERDATFCVPELTITWKDQSYPTSRGPPARRNSASSERSKPASTSRATGYEREAFHEHRSRSPRSRYQGGYRDRDGEDYRSPDYNYSRSGSRSRSRSPRRNRSPRFGGPPSRDVMMEGLPLDLREEHIFYELSHVRRVSGLTSVKVVLDRQTGKSRQFGFLHFSSQAESAAFLQDNYPSIYFQSHESTNSTDRDFKVRISYCREREHPDQDALSNNDPEWECPICFSANFATRVGCRRCRSVRPAAPIERPRGPPVNRGESDISPESSPSQFLLFLGLESSVTEELLAKGAAKLYKSSATVPPSQDGTGKKVNSKVLSTTSDANLGAKDSSMKRVLLVKDRSTGESRRFGFVEYASIEDAQAAMVKFNSMERYTISSKPVSVNFIHSGVFVPVVDQGRGLEGWTFKPLNNPSLRLAYWDDRAYVSELKTSSDADEGHDAEERKRAADKRQRSSAADKEGLVKDAKDSDGKGKKRKPDPASSGSNKKQQSVPAHLTFWRDRHAELHGIDDSRPDEKKSPNDSSTEANPAATSTTDVPNVSNDSPHRSFADLSRKCCLLCSRQFKTDADVHKHERLSKLHRDNLGDVKLKTRALERLRNVTSSTLSGPGPNGAGDDGPAYRDRARERRAAFNQPKRPSTTTADSRPGTNPGASTSAAGESTSVEEKDDAATAAMAPSKGAALLGKMGWDGGSGLGAQGTGVLVPVATEMYAAGVGLGAQGGKLGDAVTEAGRNTKSDRGGFLERTKEKAKERFERMA
ncbi:MAG: hypothetical protein M1825_003756 [Sarcosagium campestre]|nr:MAG: hypothetical protein M1825_003756 [Sarcosagium campestre]